MKPEVALIRAVRPALEALAVPEDAPPMEAYMKHRGRYLGIKSGPRKAAQRALFAEHRLPDLGAHLAAVAGIWDRAEFREERYVALELLALPRYVKHLDMSALPLIERLVVEGAWWDLVDACATPLGEILARHDTKARPALLAWASDRDLWKRRSALICQLRRKADTDLTMLYQAIEAALTAPGMESDLAPKDQRFFIHKAVGWALRQYAWTDPEEVKRYVARHPELPGLSQREALKNL